MFFKDQLSYGVHNSFFIKISTAILAIDLNVIKQIILMFLFIDSAGNLRKNRGILEYMMQKQDRDFPEKLNIYVYSNFCSYKRMHGLGFGMDMHNGEKFQWSKINFNPFGYF